MIEIRVIGLPAPQGSKRFMGIRGGKGILVESSKAVKPWREAVKWAARECINRAFQAHVVMAPGVALVSGPVSVEMTFTVPKPKSAPKTRRTFPDRKPDLSKLVRSTEDALTDAGVWEDDARVVFCTASKVFPGDNPNALDVPGALIRIIEVTA